eukprot:1213035-Pyramimonas_sp.AAC.1
MPTPVTRRARPSGACRAGGRPAEEGGGGPAQKRGQAHGRGTSGARPPQGEDPSRASRGQAGR